MKITNTTPKPVERTFTIELTENELKNITLIIGSAYPHKVETRIDSGDLIPELKGIRHINPSHTYSKLLSALNAK